MPRHTWHILGSYLRDLFTNHGIQNFYRCVHALRIYCRVRLFGWWNNLFLRAFLYFHQERCNSRIYRVLLFFFGFAAGALAENKWRVHVDNRLEDFLSFFEYVSISLDRNKWWVFWLEYLSISIFSSSLKNCFFRWLTWNNFFVKYAIGTNDEYAGSKIFWSLFFPSFFEENYSVQPQSVGCDESRHIVIEPPSPCFSLPQADADIPRSSEMM
jgi:hypothetical protein